MLMLILPRHTRALGVFFVVQNSQSRSIRALYTGDSAISTVRRPSAQRAYIREVAKQTVIMKLQGTCQTMFAYGAIF